MALDIEISGQVTKPSTIQVNTTHTRAVAFTAMIDPLAVVMELEFGSGTGGALLKSGRRCGSPRARMYQRC